MKTLVILLTLWLGFGVSQNPECNDDIVYANESQTMYDQRFNEYEKISGIPKYKGGDKKLSKLVRQNLELSDVAKTQIFRLNYQFTVTCEGKIKDVKQIGDSKADDWTNIVEIIEGTEGSWTPANKDEIPVNCVYFSAISIYGPDY